MTLNEVKANSIIKRSLDKIENQFDFNKLNTSKKSKNIGNTNTSAAVSNDPINSKDNTFTILTDEILQVSTDSTDVYTFRIEIPTKPESDFENFVIHKNSNGSIAYYIYSYKNYSDDFTALNVSRKKVNEDQINISDFDDYLPSVMKYDATNECWISITKEGNDIVIDISDCGDKGGTGGSGGTAGGGSVSNNHAFTLYGQNGNAVGYPIGNLHQVTIADITNGSSTDFDTYDPFSNSTNT